MENLSDSRISDLSALALSCGADLSGWPGALRSIAEALGADSWALLCWRGNESFPFLSAFPDGLRLDDSLPISLRSPGSPLLADKALSRRISLTAPDGSSLEAILAFFLDDFSADFSPRSEASLDALLPAFGIAVSLSWSAASLERERALARGALGALSAGAVALGSDGEPLGLEDPASSQLPSGFLCSRQALFLQGPKARKAIASAFREAISRGAPETILLPGPPPGRSPAEIAACRGPCCATLLPLAQPAGGVFAICVLSPISHRRVPTARQIMQAFGLSPAEARLARAVASGETLQHYAEECGVRMPTVRTQLREALRKAGAHRQADLSRLILSIPAARDPAPTSSASTPKPADR